jgi:hypothetical protein
LLIGALTLNPAGLMRLNLFTDWMRRGGNAAIWTTIRRGAAIENIYQITHGDAAVGMTVGIPVQNTPDVIALNIFDTTRNKIIDPAMNAGIYFTPPLIFPF